MKYDNLAFFQLVLIAVAGYYIADELLNWHEFGQILLWLFIALPVGLILLSTSIVSIKREKRLSIVLGIISLIIGIAIILPPNIIYRLFIN